MYILVKHTKHVLEQLKQYRGTFRNLSDIPNGAFCENNFHKRLHQRH